MTIWPLTKNSSLDTSYSKEFCILLCGVEMQITNGFVVTEEPLSLNKISSQTNVRSFTAQLCICVVEPLIKWAGFIFLGF